MQSIKDDDIDSKDIIGIGDLQPFTTSKISLDTSSVKCEEIQEDDDNEQLLCVVCRLMKKSDLSSVLEKMCNQEINDILLIVYQNIHSWVSKNDFKF